ELSSVFLFFLTAALTVLWFASQWHSDNVKQRAQYYLRKYEYWNGFGWKPDEQELRDTHIQIPESIRRRVSQEAPLGDYFACSSVSLSMRAVENLEETSWGTKAPADSTSQILLSISVVLLASGIVILIIALQV